MELDQDGYVLQQYDFIKECQSMLQELDAAVLLGQQYGDEHKKLLKAVIGKMGWISQMTRPSVSYDNLYLALTQEQLTVETFQFARKLLQKAINNPMHVRYNFPRSQDKMLELWTFSDAAHGTVGKKVKSTEGRITFLYNRKSNDIYLLNWRAAVIQNVCLSVKTAETYALSGAIDEVLYYQQIFKIALGIQLPIIAFTDNKSLKDSLLSSQQIKEKSMRFHIAFIKQLIEKRKVKKVAWLGSKLQLADTFTKLDVQDRFLGRILTSGKVKHDYLRQLDECKTKTDKGDYALKNIFFSRDSSSGESNESCSTEDDDGW